MKPTILSILVLFAGGVFGYSPTYAEIQEMYGMQEVGGSIPPSSTIY